MRRRFARLVRALGKTRDTIAEGIRAALARPTRPDEDGWAVLEEALVAADVGVDTAARLVELGRKSADAGGAHPDTLAESLSAEIARILSVPTAAAASPPDGPRVVMVVGVNGAGKTTTIGKLAERCRKEGRQVIVAAADTFRAAAGEQLSVWAERARADVVGGNPGGDAAAVAYDALDAAVARSADTLIVDTAGRLHTQRNLLEELKKIRRVLGKRVPGAPHQVLLVLDANTGQNALSQARLFDEALGVTGIVLAKLDGTAKGGIVVAIAEELRLPVLYVGVGEGLDDLEDFDAEVFARALTGAAAPSEDAGADPY